MPNATLIDTALRRACDGGEIAGIVAMAADRDGITYRGTFGRRDATRPAAMAEDAVFAIASMTKALTSVAAMQLVEGGKLSLDAPAAAVLPALAAPQVLEGFGADGAPRLRPATTPMTLRHLLTHTAGYGYDTWNPELGRVNAHFGAPRIPTSFAELAQVPLLFEPGTRWNYGINTDVVGKLVEAASGMTLDAYFAAHVTGPLGMADTTFLLSAAQRDRLVGLHARRPDGSLAPTERPIGRGLGFTGGGGGLCATASDYIRFLRMLLNGGSLDGARILSAANVAEMARDQIGPLDVPTMRSAVPASSCDADFFPGMTKRWGLGFLINTTPGPAGRAAGSLAWAGLLNTYYWLDLTASVGGVFLSQSLPFADPRCLAAFAAFERGVYAA